MKNASLRPLVKSEPSQMQIKEYTRMGNKSVKEEFWDISHEKRGIKSILTVLGLGETRVRFQDLTRERGGNKIYNFGTVEINGGMKKDGPNFA